MELYTIYYITSEVCMLFKSFISTLKNITIKSLKSERGSFTVEASIIFPTIFLLLIISFSYMGMAYHKTRTTLIAHKALYEKDKVQLSTTWNHLGSSYIDEIELTRERDPYGIRLKVYEFKVIQDLKEGVTQDE